MALAKALFPGATNDPPCNVSFAEETVGVPIKVITIPPLGVAVPVTPEHFHDRSMKNSTRWAPMIVVNGVTTHMYVYIYIYGFLHGHLGL